nr:immunoglobulin light chain junction region [Macaca mulatta]MOX19920.1 immunoglobulin light chain junction region [Macaca mulatta]
DYYYCSYTSNSTFVF